MVGRTYTYYSQVFMTNGRVTFSWQIFIYRVLLNLLLVPYRAVDPDPHRPRREKLKNNGNNERKLVIIVILLKFQSKFGQAPLFLTTCIEQSIFSFFLKINFFLRLFFTKFFKLDSNPHWGKQLDPIRKKIKCGSTFHSPVLTGSRGIFWIFF